MWILPTGTRLVGEGGEDPGLSPNSAERTIIQAQSGFATGSSGAPVIRMGILGASSACTGVSIQDLVIDGGPNTGDVNGIDNVNCQDQSYVDHVTIYRVKDIGLNVYNNGDPSKAAVPTNSGPYTNITFDPGTLSTSSDTNGVYLNVTTRGIQGLTCTTGNADVTSNSAGYCVNMTSAATGNTIEDVRVEGFSTGVYVGASNTVLMNIDGDTNPKSNTTTLTVVTIVGSVTDVGAIGITNNCNTNGTHNYCGDASDLTINDLATGAQLPVSTDPFVAMYVLGDKAAAGIYSRYSTSPTVPSWSVGSVGVSGACSTPGSLYSNTSGSPYALYVCSAVSNSQTWAGVE